MLQVDWTQIFSLTFKVNFLLCFCDILTNVYLERKLFLSCYTAEQDGLCVCWLELVLGLIWGNLQYEIVFELKFETRSLAFQERNKENIRYTSLQNQR